MGWMALTEQMQLYVKHKGWLMNPKTGRTFRANLSNIRRPEFQKVSGPTPPAEELEAKVTVAEAGTEALVPGEEVHIGGMEADDALDQVLAELANASKKAELRTIGVKLGLTLDKKLTNKVMREMIQDHVEKLKAFSKQ
jgi:hypothetical protein